MTVPLNEPLFCCARIDAATPRVRKQQRRIDLSITSYLRALMVRVFDLELVTWCELKVYDDDAV